MANYSDMQNGYPVKMSATSEARGDYIEKLSGRLLERTTQNLYNRGVDAPVTAGIGNITTNVSSLTVGKGISEFLGRTLASNKKNSSIEVHNRPSIILPVDTTHVSSTGSGLGFNKYGKYTTQIDNTETLNPSYARNINRFVPRPASVSGRKVIIS
jgi:hypothetical protein